MSTIPPRPDTSGSPNTRLTATALILVLLSLVLAACGGGSKRATAQAMALTTPATTTATTTTAARPPAKKHPRSERQKKHPAATHEQPRPASRPHTSATTPAKPAPKPKPEPKPAGSPSVATVAPLPAPVLSGSAGTMRAQLHGENHNPTVNKSWDYSVLATDADSHPLSGTVDTEFVFSGQVVGHETPATHPLAKGRLDDNLTFPNESVGYPLTVRVVVHTSVGTVTLDWPIKVRR